MSKTREEVSIEISKPYPFSKGGWRIWSKIAGIKNNGRWYTLLKIRRLLWQIKIAYIGESAKTASRMKAPRQQERAAVLTQVSIIGSERFNKSATLDIETSLIERGRRGGTYQLLNRNYGQRRHHYYEQNIYKAPFKGNLG